MASVKTYSTFLAFTHPLFDAGIIWRSTCTADGLTESDEIARDGCRILWQWFCLGLAYGIIPSSSERLVISEQLEEWPVEISPYFSCRYQPSHCGIPTDSPLFGDSFCQARHQELLSQQQASSWLKSAQAFLDNSQPHTRGQQLCQKPRRLKRRLQLPPWPSQAGQKQVQTLRDELQVSARPSEFENWLERSEKELESMHQGGSSPEALPPCWSGRGLLGGCHFPQRRPAICDYLRTEGLGHRKQPRWWQGSVSNRNLSEGQAERAATEDTALSMQRYGRGIWRPLVQQSWQPSHNREWFLGLTVRTLRTQWAPQDTVSKWTCRMSLWASGGKKITEAQGLMLD